MAELPARSADEELERPVAGEVRLMTEDPVPISEVDGSGGLAATVSREVARRPWLVPLAMLVLITVVVGLRRRSR